MNEIEYDVLISPSPATLGVTVSIDGADVKATVTQVPNIDFILTPTGNIIQKILSEVALPVAVIIQDAAFNHPGDMLLNKVFDVGDVPDYETEYATITASNVALGEAAPAGTTMLKVTATLAAAVPTPKS